MAKLEIPTELMNLPIAVPLRPQSELWTQIQK